MINYRVEILWDLVEILNNLKGVQNLDEIASAT